jgi:hypothetical protein
MAKQEIDKAEVCKFFREQHIREMKDFNHFAETMQRKSMFDGCVAVRFTDGTVEYYDLRPDEVDETLAFVQQLCSKRAQECIRKQEEYKD